MRVLVFSKDRPLQLDGYLASLFHHSGLPQESVTVLFVEDPSYAPLKAQYPGVEWLAEVPREAGGFHATLEAWIGRQPEDGVVLFGCDDVVFFNPFDPARMEAHLRANPGCTGVTVRFGANTRVVGRQLIPPGTPAGAIVEWDADGAGRTMGEIRANRNFFDYPFEVMGTAYRASLIRDAFTTMARRGWRYRGPNDFEAITMRMMRRRRVGAWRRIRAALGMGKTVPGDGEHIVEAARLAMFNAPSCCAAQDVNRVQDIARNLVRGGVAEDADELKRKFAAGWRMDWRHMRGITPSDCFVGMSQWRLIDAGGEPWDPARPRLAVVIPVYNRRELVLETLASVRSQTSAPWRVVVVDDGSTDGSAEAVEGWLAQHPMPCEVQVVRQANAGVSAARNLGGRKAEGADLLVFLDSDDLWPTDFVEKAVAAFTAAPEWVGASADSLIRRHDGQGKVASETAKLWRGAGPQATQAIHRTFPGTPATVVRMSVFNRLGGFPLGLQLGEDAVFFLLASTVGPWGRIACSPVVYRYFEPAMGASGHLSSIRSPDVFVQFAQELDARAEALRCVPQLRSAITHRWRRAGKAMAEAGRLREARWCYKRAIRRLPWDMKARWKKTRLRFQRGKTGGCR